MQSRFQLRNETQASALRTFGGNGFGDAAIGHTEPHAFQSSVELYHLARSHRSFQLRQVAAAALQTVSDFVRESVGRLKRRQQARATYAALRGLDAHILRDLGFHRSELMSVAAEVAGVADFTRARFVFARHSRPV
ncbi:MAG TPA: DUF1127 domain-containing protein [Burkholderiaceae bacterium]|nr:DUF1127 domain-containing protein [Burkholderiaceae bacterium]